MKVSFTFPVLVACVVGCVTEASRTHPWKDKTVAFLGDSITDLHHVGTTRNYWQDLEVLTGLKAEVFAVSGDRWAQMPDRVRQMEKKVGRNVDAIFVFAGTNDFESGVPLGEWYDVLEVQANWNGRIIKQPRRMKNNDRKTVRGCINWTMARLKSEHPDAQIVLMTPIHRGLACFSETNVQPDDSFPNCIGHYLDDYVDVVKEAGDVWAVPVINLYSDSGLYPVDRSFSKYFHDEKTDLLHPNEIGHLRLARTIAARLTIIPPGFREKVDGSRERARH